MSHDYLGLVRGRRARFANGLIWIKPGATRTAAAIAVVTLMASFLALLFINLIQWWSRRYAA